MERHSESPKTLRRLCLSTKFPHHEIRWNLVFYTVIKASHFQITVFPKKCPHLEIRWHFMQCMFLFINWKRKDAFENSYYSRSHSKWTVDYLWLEQEDMISTAIATMLSLERSYIPYSGCFYIRSLLLSHKLLWYKRPYDLQSKISWYSNFKKFTGNFFSLQFLDSEVEAKFLCATTINCLHDFEKMGGFLKNFFVYLSISNCWHIHFITFTKYFLHLISFSLYLWHTIYKGK